MMVGGKERAVRLWKSTDLLNWEVIGDIPNKAAECIDMYTVAVDGDRNNMKWIIADAATRYEVGEFDGTVWKVLGDKDKDGNRFKFDYGDAYYAAQAFNQGPGGRVVHVGWLRSKQQGYRPFLDAGMPFTQQMSIPAEITLKNTPEGIRMFRNPVKEIEKLYSSTKTIKDTVSAKANVELSSLSAELIDMTAEFSPSDLTLDIRGLKINYDAGKGQFNFTNTKRIEGEKPAFLKNPKFKGRKYRDTGFRAIPAPAVKGRAAPVDSPRAFTGIHHTSRLPPRSEMKKSCFPSQDHTGL